MPLPRISIVTPSLNQGRFVRWTVRSVLLQAYPRLQYIVMDGGSTDETLDVLEPFRHRIDRLVSAPDGGQADALLRGFEHASGDILAWLNSDDMLAPGTLHFVAEFFQSHPEIDLVYSHRCRVDESNRVRGYWILPRHRDDLMRLQDLIPQETCFWRRDLMERAGSIDASYQFAMDYDLFLRFMQVGRLERVNRFLGAFRAHPHSKTVARYETDGRADVRRLTVEHELPVGLVNRVRRRAFTERVRLRSAWHVISRRRLPGAGPGVGYDYDDVWAGRLDRDDPVS